MSASAPNSAMPGTPAAGAASTTQPQPQPQPQLPPLRIAAEGLCSALGYTLPRTAAAIRARLNLFRETRFVGLGGKPVVGAMMHGFDIWGGMRQAALLRLAFEEVWERARAAEGEFFSPASTALLLLLPPIEQRAIPLRELHEAFQSLTETHGLHRASRAMHAGRGGVAAGIQLAGQWLTASDGAGEGGRGGGGGYDGGGERDRAGRTGRAGDALRHVLVIASDSLLTAPTIERLLSQRRLPEERYTDALIPGEAAAALMLTRLPARVASHGATSPDAVASSNTAASSVPSTGGSRTASTEVWITGAAHGHDDWRLDADTPLLARGLTAVLREAARQAGVQVADAEFHASGMNGEHWMAREIELALSRAMERKRVDFPHHRIAQFIGDAGTAGAVATLAWIAHAMRGDHPPGRVGLLHFSEDDGQRSALLLRAREPVLQTA